MAIGSITYRQSFLFLSLVFILSFSFQRLSAQDGGIDLSFDPGLGANGSIDVVTLQPDGKILIGGSFTEYDGVPSNRIARLYPDGTLDSTFVSGSPNDDVLAIAVQSDGRIWVGGRFNDYFDGNWRIVRLLPDGSQDTTFNQFGAGANATVRNIVIQPDDKILVGGDFTVISAGTSLLEHHNGLVRLLEAEGTIDSTFNIGSGAENQVSINTITLKPNGKIIVAGNFSTFNGVSQNKIAQLNPNGTLDTAFNPGAGPAGAIFASSLQANGKLIIGGPWITYNNFSRLRVARIDTVGSLDTTFNKPSTAVQPGMGVNGIVFSTLVQSDGKIIIAGNFPMYISDVFASRNGIVRTNPNGTLDTTFNPGMGINNGFILDAVIQPDGNIIIVGDFSTYDTISRNNIARILVHSCQVPDSLFTSNITDQSADLDWRENGNAAQWEVEFGNVGFSLGSGTRIVTGAKPYSMTGLSPNASYDVYVRSICSNNVTSEWSAAHELQTSNTSSIFTYESNQSKLRIYDRYQNIVVEAIDDIKFSQIIVFDASGRELERQHYVSESRVEIPVSHFSSGIYVVRVQDTSGKFHTQKIPVASY